MVRTFAGERDHYICVAITDAAGRVLLKLSFESMTVVNVKEEVHEAHSTKRGITVTQLGAWSRLKSANYTLGMPVNKSQV